MEATDMQILRVCGVAAFVIANSLFGAHAHELSPGLYRIQVTFEPPKLLGPPVSSEHLRCVTTEELDAHDAFVILSETPMRSCQRVPICFGNGKAGFHAICPGGEGGEAVGKFDMAADGFNGTIEITMGATTLTSVERQVANRIGPCRAGDTE